jgi:hypothetical protein
MSGDRLIENEGSNETENDLATVKSAEYRAKLSRELARQSLVAAILTFLGGVAVIISLAWSYSRLRTTTAKLHEIETTIEVRKNEKNDLEHQIANLRKEKNAYATLLAGVNPEAVGAVLNKHPHAAALVLSVNIRIAAQSQSDLAVRVAGVLRSKGIIVPTMEMEGVDKPANGTQIRYFSRSDEKRKDLESIQTALSQIGINAIPTFVSASSSPTQANGRYFELCFAANEKVPIALMSNSELKAAVVDFIGRTQGENLRINDLQERVARARDRLNGVQSSEMPAAESYLKASDQALTNEINSFVEQNVPAANQYLDQLEGRLNSQEHLPRFSAGPGVGSLNAFSMRVRNLDVLAAQLK